MRPELYDRVALSRDVNEHSLKKGDLALLVDRARRGILATIVMATSIKTRMPDIIPVQAERNRDELRCRKRNS
jgi:hypothetical protein